MFQKHWKWILVAGICLLVLGATLWAVLGGISSVVSPPPPAVPPLAEDAQEPPALSDENYPMVDESGEVIGDDNFLDDPWAFNAEDERAEDAQTPQDEISETPQDEGMTDEELAVTDEGWSGIY